MSKRNRMKGRRRKVLLLLPSSSLPLGFATISWPLGPYRELSPICQRKIVSSLDEHRAGACTRAQSGADGCALSAAGDCSDHGAEGCADPASREGLSRLAVLFRDHSLVVHANVLAVR